MDEYKSRFFNDNWEGYIKEFDYEQKEYLEEYGFGDKEDWVRLCERLNELYSKNKELEKQRNGFLNDLDKLEQTILSVKEEFIDDEIAQTVINEIIIRKKRM